MPSVNERRQCALGRLLFRHASVTRAEMLGTAFRRLVLAGADLRGVKWTPGDKLQVYLSSVGMRTYTPVRWDAAAGETELIAYLHGDTPAMKWAKNVASGDAVQLFGPRDSLVVGSSPSAVVFGDETSVGLVAANGDGARAVLEATHASEVEAALGALRLTGATVIERQAADAHHEAMIDAMVRTTASHPGSNVVLSGRGVATQAVRRGLKERGIDLSRSRAKAYWAPGKTGLD